MPKPTMNAAALLNGWERSAGKDGDKYPIYLTAYDRFDFPIERHGFKDEDAMFAFADENVAPTKTPKTKKVPW